MEVKDYRVTTKEEYLLPFKNLLTLISDNQLYNIFEGLIEEKDRETICKILESKTNIVIHNSAYSSLYLNACKMGWVDVIDTLVKKGISVHYDNDEGIFKALKTNDLKFIKYLESLGLSLENDLNRAMSIATNEKNKELAQYILDNYF